MKKPIDDILKRQIAIHIKNRLDIGSLIKDVDIRGLDLSYAIIKEFNRINDDISNCNFSNAVIGEEGKITNLSGSKMVNCCFKEAKLLGRVLMKNVDGRNCNFRETFMPYVEYQYSNFEGASFCDAIFRIGSRVGIGAKFDKNLFAELSKWWGITYSIKSKESE